MFIIFLLWFIGLKDCALTMEADHDNEIIHAIILEGLVDVISMFRVHISKCFKTVDP
jgi:hypothetical protein